VGVMAREYNEWMNGKAAGEICENHHHHCNLVKLIDSLNLQVDKNANTHFLEWPRILVKTWHLYEHDANYCGSFLLKHIMDGTVDVLLQQMQLSCHCQEPLEQT
jgi:hypothetical protein